MITVEPLTADDQDWVQTLIAEHWGGEPVVSGVNQFYVAELPGFKAVMKEQRVGIAHYHIADEACEIVTLISLIPDMGVGSQLIEAVRDAASAAGCRRLWLLTTNDNLHALGFYQRRGFQLATVHRDAMAAVRKLKPGIPDIGAEGIPLRDTIELEYLLPTPSS